jgi:hypothetical protein
LKLESVCSRIFIENNSEQQQLHRHHEDVRFSPDRKIVRLTEDIVKESLTNVVCFPSRIFSLQESKHSHNSLSSCCCSLHVIHTVCRQPYAIFSHSNSHTQIQNPHGPLYRPMLSFFISIKDEFFPSFHQDVARRASGHCSSANGRKLQLPHSRYFIHHIT